MAGLNLVTAPVEEPITTSEAKLQLRIEEDDTDRDFQIFGMIIAAREFAENFTNRKFITQTWDYTLDSFPATGVTFLQIPFGGLRSVDSFGYIDSAGLDASLDGSPTQYYVDTISEPGRIYLSAGGMWPIVPIQENIATIRFTTGYGLAAAVPRAIKLGMLLYVEALFDKDPAIMNTLVRAAENILLPYRVYTIA
jgi:uncharacterized phiE125 gp8 family phage protein